MWWLSILVIQGPTNTGFFQCAGDFNASVYNSSFFSVKYKMINGGGIMDLVEPCLSF